MQLILFILSFVKPKNWPLLFYFLLNAGLMFLFEYLIYKQIFGILPLIYGSSLLLITLPFGEAILRFKSKASPIRCLGNDRIINLYNEVYDIAKQKSKLRLSKSVKLYFVNDNSVNACALGFRTMIVNTGILNCTDNQIKAILFHEFSHLIEQDSVHNVAFNIGNIILFICYVLIKIILSFIVYFFTYIIAYLLESVFGCKIDATKVSNFVGKIIDKIYDLWNLLGLVICMYTSRLSEYNADKFAKFNGYGKELANILSLGSSTIDGNENTLFLTHPPTHKRIERLL